ncbi:MAG TPA: LysM peptidoglycan-binding domain-containing protein [Archangium sp.]|uniref:LysM peptidoglycan-binding domain-containing protein n=1 Tax=Archangium sp. TaxID=1872627 RepID=UPI002E37B2D7|nr:LysM peptidoglycan-binding domain-containing protein [Archangium sp.]HEX5747476.1 LysM peptidoglycan-binding domain-containing protein [Archangium sp.]
MSTYRIRSGDTLSGIARRHNTTVDALARANNIENPDQIRRGQRIQIPDGFDRPSVQRPRARASGEDTFTPATRPQARPSAAPTSAPTPPVRPEGLGATPAAPPAGAQPLGSLSRQYEARGGPGTVSSGNGDSGGVSYGSYQLSSNRGTAQRFVDSLRTSHPDYHAALSAHAPGTEAFSNAWRELARQDPQRFDRAQHDFIQATHYDVAARGIQQDTGLDLNTRSAALRDVAWSTAVQHGPGNADSGAREIFQRALAGRDPATVTDEQLIRDIYAERGRRDANGELAHFSRNSAAVQRGVANRFVSEEANALEMLRQERAGAPQTPAAQTPASAAPASVPVPQPRPADLAAQAQPPAPVTAPGTAAPRQVQVPFYSQFEGGHGFEPGNEACFRAATAMARDAGVTVQGPDRRIQVGTSEDAQGRLTVDPARAREGREYIDGQLDAGRPVVVGVSHRDANYNVDNLTDHFVAITGRGVDEQGRTYYTFNDPGTRHGNIGADTNPNNRFYVDGNTGMLYRPEGAGGSIDMRRYDVSMVRRNAQ